MSKPEFTESDLEQFIDTEKWYRHWTGRLLFTNGIHFLVEHGAGWLVDAIASYQPSDVLQKGMNRDFQLREMNVYPEDHVPRAQLTCRADSDRPAVIVQDIEFTDFPLPSIKLYVERGEELVLMLPSER
jgi:hypothetical protein